MSYNRQKYANNGYTKRKTIKRKAASAKRKKNKEPKKKRTYKKGYDRVVGNYGRYNGPGHEKKWKDQIIDQQPLVESYFIHDITIIPQGTGPSQRIGRRITITDIHLKMSAIMLETTVVANTSDIIKCIFVQDKQTNGIRMTGVDLVEVNNIWGFRKLTNSKRFKVLWEWTMPISTQGFGGGIGATTSSQKSEWTTANLKSNIIIEYDGPTGAVGEIKSNNVYFATISESGLVAITGTVRIRYTDL